MLFKSILFHSPLFSFALSCWTSSLEVRNGSSDMYVCLSTKLDVKYCCIEDQPLAVSGKKIRLLRGEANWIEPNRYLFQSFVVVMVVFVVVMFNISFNTSTCSFSLCWQSYSSKSDLFLDHSFATPLRFETSLPRHELITHLYSLLVLLWPRRDKTLSYLSRNLPFKINKFLCFHYYHCLYILLS